MRDKVERPCPWRSCPCPTSVSVKDGDDSYGASVCVLQKDYRRLFPFRLATTSYIYPCHAMPNAVLLAPYLDEMELILFESENLPDPEEISSLCGLGRESGLSYHVHFPLDVFLGSPSRLERLRGVGAVLEAVRLTELLNPSTYTLHYVHDGLQDLSTWLRHIGEGTESIVDAGVEPAKISIETLDYPITWVEEVIAHFGLSVCLDFGHIVRLGEDPLHYLDRYGPKTSVIHLHGVRNGRDHQGLDCMDGETVSRWLSALKDYTGIVSLEVFAFEALQASLRVMEEARGDR